jgi:tetratricopeptide (TPR) repeat protein
MTNNRGYIYVLANSAMPDLVKVGKTTRTPAERAAELSKVTGVPTPFIVVYEQLVDDCTAAEEFVHTMLQQKGYRESDNREFFRAPVSEIVGIIAKMPTQFSSNSDFEDDEDAEFFSSESNDELDEFVLDDDDFEDYEPEYPWLEIWEMAEKYRYGSGDFIQDYDEAMKLYKQAIKLGCFPAYGKIGNFYNFGHGVSQNDKKALEWYKEGIKKGDYYCYSDMGDLFASSGQFDNFHKCYKLLFKNFNQQQNELVEKLHFDGFSNSCQNYIAACFSHNAIIPAAEVVKEIKKVKQKLPSTKLKIIYFLTARIKKYSSNQENFYQNLVLNYQKGIKWVEENL